jgi:DNA-binding Xre family transcriptional regulator
MFNEREFEAQLVRKGIKKYELADRLGMSYTNLYRKIKTGRFTREEIGKIIDIAGIDDPVPIFFADKLT